MVDIRRAEITTATAMGMLKFAASAIRAGEETSTAAVCTVVGSQEPWSTPDKHTWKGCDGDATVLEQFSCPFEFQDQQTLHNTTAR